MIKRLRAGWKRALGYFRRNGISAAAWAEVERLLQKNSRAVIVMSLLPRKSSSGREGKRKGGKGSSGKNPPSFSVVVPAYETPPVFLRALLDSMQHRPGLTGSL